jgi:hypothetical protein
MKKFGTPSGAAPGIEKENVGLAAVGTPFLVVGLGLVVVLGPVGPVGFLPLVPVGPLGPLPLLPVGPLGPRWEPPP